MSILHYDFCGEYEMMLSAWGEGELHEKGLISNLTEIFQKFKKEYKRKPNDISLFIEDSMSYGFDYGFTSVDTAFLEKLDTLKELILPDSITDIKMTPTLEKILKENNTLIRGTFNSFAERFANENGLNFRHSDYRFAYYFFEPAQESTELNLIFKRDGTVIIEEKISSPGSSAGNTFGGEFYHSLKSDFYMTQTAEDVAGMFGKSLYNAIISSGKLANFIETAKTHKIYTGEN